MVSQNSFNNTLPGLTNHGIVVAKGNSPIGSITPAAIAGTPCVSNGPSADPVFNVICRSERGVNQINDPTTSYNLSFADANTFITSTATSTLTITVLSDSDGSFVDNPEVDFFQQGVGQVVFAAGAGVTIQSAFNNLKISTQYACASLKHIAANTWVLTGNLTA